MVFKSGANITAGQVNIPVNVDLGTSISSLHKLASAFLTVESVGTRAMQGLGVAVAGFALVGAQELVKWDKQWRNVWTLFPDVAEESMRATSAVIKDWARDNERTMEEVGAAWFTAASAFSDPNISRGLLDAGSDLARATNTELQPAIESLTVALRAHGAAAGDAARFTDILTRSSQLSRVSLDELAASMSTAIGTTADFDIAFEEVMAATAALTQAGDDPGEAYTQLRAVVAELADPTSGAGANLIEETGKSFAEWRAQGLGLVDIMKKIREATGGSSDALLSFFGRVWAGQATLALTGNQLRAYEEYLDEITNSAGAAELAVEKQTGSIQHNWEEVVSAFKGAADSFVQGGESIITILDSLEFAFKALGIGGDALSVSLNTLFQFWNPNAWQENINIVAEYIPFLDSAAESADKAAKAEEARQRLIADGQQRTQQARNEAALYANIFERRNEEELASIRQRTHAMDANFIRSQRTVAAMQEERWQAEQLKEEMAAVAQQTYEAGLAAAEWARTVAAAGEVWDGWMNQIFPGGPHRSPTDGDRIYTPKSPSSSSATDTRSAVMSGVQGLAKDFLDKYKAPMDLETQKQFFLSRRKEDRAVRDRYGLDSYGLSDFKLSDITKNQRFAAEIQLEASRRMLEAVEKQEEANDKARREYQKHLQDMQQQQADLHKQIMEDAMGGGETNRQWFNRRLGVVNDRGTLIRQEAERLFGLARGAMDDDALSRLDVGEFFERATFSTGFFGGRGMEGFVLTSLQRLWDEWFKKYRDQAIISDMFGPGSDTDALSGFLGAAGFGGPGRPSSALSFGNLGNYVRDMECDLTRATDEQTGVLRRIEYNTTPGNLGNNFYGVTDAESIAREMEMSARMNRF